MSPKEDPRIVIISGTVGAGKSTVVHGLEKIGYFPIKIDDYYQKVSRVDDDVEWYDDKEYIENCYREMLNDIKMQLEQGNNIVIETTGISPHWVWLSEEIDNIKVARVSIYLDISKTEMVKRVEKRNASDYEIKQSKEDLDFFYSKKDNLHINIDYRVASDGTEEEVLQRVVRLL